MRKLATICLGFSAAVFVCQYLLPGAAWIYGAAAALLLAGICALVLREYARLRAVLMLLGLCAGFLVNGFYMQTVYMPAAAMDGYSGNITATAIAYPESTEYGSRIMVRLNTEGRHNAKTTLFCYDNHGDTADIRPGDIISVPAEISIANTIGGEETDYYSSRGIFLTASARGQLQITHLDKTPVKYLPAVVCQAVKEKLAQIYDGSQLGFMQAILTGDKSLINDDTPLRTRLNTVGLSHVIAISGMHVSFLTGFLAMVIPNRRRFAAVAIPVLIFFAMMVGGAPSVVRACFMQTMLLIAPLVRRESDSVTSLSTVLAVLLFANPFSAKNVGLQLSFAATAGILLLSERLIKRMLSSAAVKRAEKALPRPLRIRRGTGRNPLVYFICASIATSVGAIIFTCPLSALYFDYISLIAPLANLLCLWAVTAIFVVGIFTVLLGFIWLPLALGVSVAVKILLMYLFIAVKILAKFPWAAAYTENRYIVYWLVFLYASVAALLFVKEKKKPVIAPTVLIVCALAVALGLGRAAAGTADMSVAFLDVGQGACSVITGGGGTVVVDCGGEYGTGNECSGYILSRGERKIDYFILTHTHSDHANGAVELLTTVKTEYLLLSEPVTENDELRDDIIAAAEENGTEIIIVTDLVNFTAGNIEITVYPPVSDSNENERCISCTVSDANFDVLYTGDMSTSGEQSLYSTYLLPDIEVLAVGHHGSKYSTSRQFLEVTRPEMAVISVGADNTYGHPTDETLSRLEEAGTQVKRTDLNGRVIINFNAQEE